MEEHTSDDIWEQHKVLIQRLFLQEDQSLNEVRQFMEQNHSFKASKYKYESKLNMWGFKKNLKRKDWPCIEYHASKRAKHGKRTEVRLNGRPMNPKTVSKAIGRNRYSASNQFCGNKSPKLPPGIDIRTPSLSPTISPRKVNLEGNASSYHSIGIPLQATEVLGNLGPLGFMTSGSPSGEASSTLSKVCDMPTYPDSAHTIDWISAALLHNLPFHSFLNDSGLLSDHHTTLSLKESTSAMWSKVRLSLPPESFIYRFQSLIQKPSNTNCLGATGQEIAEVILYLISNNSLWDQEIAKVLESIAESMPAALLRNLLSTRSPTVQALSTRFLETAAKHGWASIIQLLIKHGIDSSLLARLPGFRLLQQTLYSTYRASEREEIAELLISHGAYVNHDLCYMYRSPLCLAIENGFPNIARNLLKVGAVYGPPSNYMRWQLAHIVAKAAGENDLEKVQLLFDGKVDFDTLKIGGQTPLVWSLNNGSIDLHTILLDSNPAAMEYFSAFGLIGEAEDGLKAVRNYLDDYSEETDPEQWNKEIAHALCFFMQNGVNTEIKLLLAEQINPLFYEDDEDVEYSPLYLAVKLNDWVVANILVENGMAIDLSNYLVLNSISVDMLRLLIDSGGVDLEEHGPAALLHSLLKWDEEAVSILIEAGVGLGTPLLSETKQRGVLPNVEMLEFLVELGVNSEFFNVDLLLVAVEAHDFNAIDFLCENFVDINSPSQSGRYPIQAAMKQPSLELVKYLNNLGADLNPPPNELKGLSTLNYALRGGDRQIFDLVIEAGAEVLPRKSMHLTETLFESCFYKIGTMFEYRQGGQHRIEMFRYLLTKGAAPTISRLNKRSEKHPVSALACLIKYCDSTDLIYEFIEAGVDVNESGGEKGNTPLQAAASKGSTELIECLLEKGAEINAPAWGAFGRTALQAACSRRDKENYISPIKLLLGRGADVNGSAGIEYGVTALQATAIEGQVKSAILLLNAGADVNADGAIKGGRKALDGAAERGRLDMVKLLLNAGACSNKNEDGTPGFDEAIRLAELEGHWAVADLIRSHIRANGL